MGASKGLGGLGWPAECFGHGQDGAALWWWSWLGTAVRAWGIVIMSCELEGPIRRGFTGRKSRGVWVVGTTGDMSTLGGSGGMREERELRLGEGEGIGAAVGPDGLVGFAAVEFSAPALGWPRTGGWGLHVGGGCISHSRWLGGRLGLSLAGACAGAGGQGQGHVHVQGQGQR